MSSGSGSFVAGSITSGLKFDVSEYVGGMMKVESIAHLFPQIVTSFMASPLLAVVDLLKEAATSAFEFGKECLFTFADVGHEAGEMATALGMDAVAFQEVAAIFGTGTQSMARASEVLKFLAKSADDAVHGTEASAKAYARLGIPLDQVKAGMTDLPGLLFKVSDGLASLSGAERIGVGLDVLGRGAMESMGKLAKGSAELRAIIEEARGFGMILGPEQLEAADKYTDAIKSLNRAWMGFKLNVGGPLLEAFLPELEALVQWAITNKDEIIQMARDIAAAFKWAFDQIISQIKQMMPIIEGFAKGGAWGGIGAMIKYAAGSAWNFSLLGLAVNSMVRAQAPGMQNPYGPSWSGVVVNQDVNVNRAMDEGQWLNAQRHAFRDLRSQMDAEDARARVSGGL